MPTPENLPITPLNATCFEEVIDGYFPLQVSLSHMMARWNATTALISFSHAPVLEVPGLPPTAPVPLNIRAGRAGLVTEMALRVDLSGSGLKVQGFGEWRWLDGGAQSDRFDPMTRLAEPALVSGVVICPAPTGSKPPPNAAQVDVAPSAGWSAQALLERLGWDAGHVLAPLPPQPVIARRGDAPSLLERIDQSEAQLPRGSLIALRLSEDADRYLTGWDL